MMKSLIFLLFCLPLFAQGASELEESIILQNELRFLEDISKTDFITPNTNSGNDLNLNSSNDLDLESTYFNSRVDEVRTRSSAPRRRAP